LTDDVANAIEDHYKPRFAGDELPRNQVGLVVALADKLETLVGMFGIGNTPTGEKDPFALRRHALGVVRIIVDKELPLELSKLISIAHETFEGKEVAPLWPMSGLLDVFCQDRLIRMLESEGCEQEQIWAALGVQDIPKWSALRKRLLAVRTFAALPEAPALAAANKRVGNILKKAEGTVEAKVNPALLQVEEEVALHIAINAIAARADLAWANGDYTGNLQALAALKDPVDAFFDKVMVNAEDPALKANRLGLLATLHNAMNRVADLSKLAS
jgi:glycyl-tRNA synthetase beta chain